ncbi:hypothetical protein HHL22_04330 [Hymenobacter sp. RP-2-7]|uniref:Uncharacterized protein n=1 Tax=Hymenobacter polaris TaxID=2682546 RepID=A0A7Y0FLI1_9BACT|nr:hypothetical protein [Hymenobacter polaris]NML64426.1 hypothetical protein [Hymenobacter polaris]
MRIAPFYYDPPTAATPPATRPPRAPYHDNSDCPEGQRVRASGHWRPYEPTRVADTRVRCPVCLALDKLSS